jgi:hypothetical protein
MNLPFWGDFMSREAVCDLAVIAIAIFVGINLIPDGFDFWAR